jgi:hypothetical protein
MMIAGVLLLGAGFLLVERLWPANALPRVRARYARVLLINAIQAGSSPLPVSPGTCG